MEQTQQDYPLNIFADTDSRTQKIDTFDLDVFESLCDQVEQEHQITIKHAIRFYLPSQAEPITFIGDSEINIGRRDPKGRITPELDLSDFQARELGVSRLHALITWDGTQYMLQDLHSTNHTYLNGQRLFPYQYAPLTDNCTVQVGHLMMTVYIINQK